jgi:hypothetical protein
MSRLRLKTITTILCAQLAGLWAWATVELASQGRPNLLGILFFLLALVHLVGFIFSAIDLWFGMGEVTR